jgi:hypothetical protein
MNTRLWLTLSAGIPIALAAPFSPAQVKATVVSTSPANGANGVSRHLTSFSMTYSKTMDVSRCGATNWTYPNGTCFWSADQKTMTLTRVNAIQLADWL